MTWSQPRVPARATRRGVLAAALGPAGWLLSGCDGIGLPEAPPSATPVPSGDAGPDAALLRQAADAASSAHAVTAAVVAAHPALAPALTPLREMHDAHLAVIGGTRSASPAPAPTAAPVRRSAALRAVRESEEQYAAALLTGVRDATSGELARVLASARAGVLMHLAALAPHGTSTSGPTP